jgi:hypothetical protein
MPSPPGIESGRIKTGLVGLVASTDLRGPRPNVRVAVGEYQRVLGRRTLGGMSDQSVLIDALIAAAFVGAALEGRRRIRGGPPQPSAFA